MTDDKEIPPEKDGEYSQMPGEGLQLQPTTTTDSMRYPSMTKRLTIMLSLYVAMFLVSLVSTGLTPETKEILIPSRTD